MPRRVIDGEATLYTSRKLAQVQPPELRGHYAWFLPLALSNGVFECDPSLVWEKSCAFNRPEISVETVEQSFAEFERLGLLGRWREPDGKEWGCFPELRKPWLLPSPSRQKHYQRGPEPPQELLARFEAIEADGQPAVNNREADNAHAFLPGAMPKNRETVGKDSPESPWGSGNGNVKDLPLEHPLDEPGDLPLVSLAAHIVEVLCLPDSPQLRDDIAESIRSKAHTNGITAVAAHDRVLLEAAVDWQAGKPLFGCSDAASPRR